MNFPTPTQEEISDAIDEGNIQLIAQYAVSLEYARQQVSAEIPRFTEAFGNAKRDLDTARAAAKFYGETIKTLQSIMRQLKP